MGGDPVNIIDPEGEEALTVLVCAAAVESVALEVTANDFGNLANNNIIENLNHLKDIAKSRVNECIAKGDNQGVSDALDILASIDKQLSSEALNSLPTTTLASQAAVATAVASCAVLLVTPGL